MLTPTRGLPVNLLAAPAGAPQLRQPNFGESNSSFAQQLADSLHSLLNENPGVTQFQVNISPQTSPDAGTRQFLVTITQPGASAAPPVLDVTGMLMYSGTVEPAPAVEPEPEPFTDQADAYWAMHPPEVQALRTIQDPLERGQLGWELAQKGFIIDNEIMILGWDPYMTMKVRKELGYTWFPALGQTMTPVAPGISFPGLPSYDPANPPPGSIAVSTDFAIGLEHTSPCGRPAHPPGFTPPAVTTGPYVETSIRV